MNAITEKMKELARKKEEELQQQARDSDTLSTIVVPPTVTDPGTLSRPTAPPRPDVRRNRGSDAGRAAAAGLRRVETDLAAVVGGERRRVDRPSAFDGEESDDSSREVVGGRPGQLKRWPRPSDGDEQGTPRRRNDEESDDDDNDDQPSGNNKRRPVSKHPAPPASWQPESSQSTPTATPDDSRTDSSLVHSQNTSDPARLLISRATVI